MSENIKELGEIFYKGNIINLEKESLEKLENISQELKNDKKNIKNQIFNLLETF